MPTIPYLSEKHRIDLAEIVMQSASLEHTVDMVLCSVTPLDADAYQQLAGQRTLGPKLELLAYLGARKLRSGKKRKELAAIVAGLSALNRKRVIVVHGIWRPKGGWTLGLMVKWFSDSLGPMEVTHERGNRGVEIIKAESLEGIGEGMRIAHAQLWKFWKVNWVQPAVRRSLKRNPP